MRKLSLELCEVPFDDVSLGAKLAFTAGRFDKKRELWNLSRQPQTVYSLDTQNCCSSVPEEEEAAAAAAAAAADHDHVNFDVPSDQSIVENLAVAAT